jgi:hypothetical protein
MCLCVCVLRVLVCVCVRTRNSSHAPCWNGDPSRASTRQILVAEVSSRARGWEGGMMYRHLGALLRCHVTWRMRLLLRHKHDSQSTRINTRTHGKTRTSLLGTGRGRAADWTKARARAAPGAGARAHGRTGAQAQICTG